MTPAELLDAATSLAANDESAVWPRAGALLARQALEEAVEQFYLARSPGLESCSGRVQFICLQWYVDKQLAHEAQQVWAELSRACHVHAYELAPTGHELQRWIDRVEQVRAALTL